MARLPILNESAIEANINLPQLSDINKNISELVKSVDNLVSSTDEKTKEESEQSKSLESISKSVSSNTGYGGARSFNSQSLMNLSASRILRDTAGDIRGRILNRFQNNSFVRFGMNMNNAINAFRGNPTSNAFNNRKELTQEQLEDKRENIERQDKTNELLESILKALLDDKNIELPKNKSFFTKIISEVLPYFSLGKKLITALGIGAIAGLGAWLAENNLASVANNIKRFFEIVKNLNMPKFEIVKKFTDSVDSMGTWFKNSFEKIKGISLTDINDSFKTNLQKVSTFISDLKNNVLEKYDLPKIDKAFENNWSKMTNFFSDVVTKIKLDNIPGKDILDQLNDVFLKITNKLNGFIDQANSILNKVGLSKIPVGGVQPLSDISSNIPSSKIVSDISSTTPPIEVVSEGSNLGTLKPTAVPNPVVAGAKNIGNIALKGLGVAGTAATVANAGINIYNPENITGVKKEDATVKDRINAGVFSVFDDIGFTGLIDFFRGVDTRRTRFETQKLTKNLGPLAPIAAFFMSDYMNKKYTVENIDKEVIEQTIKLIEKEEDFKPTAYPEKLNGEYLKWDDGTQRYAVGYGFNTIDGVKVKKDDTITKEKANSILEKWVTKLNTDVKNATRFNAGDIYKDIDNVTRRATLLSMGYQMGTGGTKEGNKSSDGLIGSEQKPLWDAIKKANEDENWKNVKVELLKLPQAIRFKRDDQTETRFDRNANQMETGEIPSAMYGNISYKPQKIIVGDYKGAKQNPELSLALSDLESRMLSFSEKINELSMKNYSRNSDLMMTAYQNRMEKLVENSTKMEKRVNALESMSTGKSQSVQMPIVNNVVDNSNINNTNQSILLKRNVANYNNPFLMLS